MDKSCRYLFVVGLFWILITGCSQQAAPDTTSDVDPKEVMVRPTTKVFSAEMRQALSSYSMESGTLRFPANSPQAEAIKVGQVLVSEPSKAAPYGFLRKVKSKVREGQEWVVQTEPAALEDAIVQGATESSGALKPSQLVSAKPLSKGVTLLSPRVSPQGEFLGFDIDLDEDVAEGIKVRGRVAFSLGYNVGIGIKCGWSWDLPPVDCSLKFNASLYMNELTSLGITGNGTSDSTPFKLGPKKLAEYEFGAIVFAIGPIPIVIIPKIVVSIGADGHLRGDLSLQASQSLYAEAGIRKNYGKSPQPFFTSKHDSSLDLGDLKVLSNPSFDVRPYVSVSGELMLYGVAGPGAELQGYVSFKRESSNSAAAWSYKCGVKANFYLKINTKFWDYNNAWPLFDQQLCSGSSPNYGPVIKGVAPATDTTVELYQPIELVADMVDLEGSCCKVSWVSNMDGELGNAAKVKVPFGSEGPRTITLTVTDAQGESASHSITLNVKNSPPRFFGDGLVQKNNLGKPPKVGMVLNFDTFVNDINEQHRTGDGYLRGSLVSYSTSNPGNTALPGEYPGHGVSLVIGAPGTFILTARARDTQGLEATLSKTFTAQALQPGESLPPQPLLMKVIHDGTNKPLRPNDEMRIEYWMSAPSLGNCLVDPQSRQRFSSILHLEQPYYGNLPPGHKVEWAIQGPLYNTTGPTRYFAEGTKASYDLCKIPNEREGVLETFALFNRVVGPDGKPVEGSENRHSFKVVFYTITDPK